MTIYLNDRKEFFAGAVFAVIGATWVIRATSMNLGSATSMGPGFFPLVVALVLTFTGTLSMVRAVRTNEVHTLASWNMTAIVFVLAGAAAFAFLIDRAGVIVATVALVMISSPARLLRKPLEVVALAVAVATFVTGLFVYVLGLALPLFGS